MFYCLGRGSWVVEGVEGEGRSNRLMEGIRVCRKFAYIIFIHLRTVFTQSKDID